MIGNKKVGINKSKMQPWKNIVIIGFIVSMILMPGIECKAASASVTLSTDSSSITKGEDFIVSLQLASDDLIGDFEAFISYNDDVLEFKNGASFIAGGEGLLKLSDTNVSEGDYTRKYIIKFTAKETGNSDITINDKAAIYDFETALDMSVSVNKLNIQVVSADKASDNANLQSLKISPSGLSPDFDPAITEYTTSVTNDIEQLVISALPEDNNAVVSTKGNEKLKVGENKITITIKAESGDTKDYFIEVQREESIQDNSGQSIEEVGNKQSIEEQNTSESESTQINSLFVTQEEGKTYIQNGYRLQIAKASDIAGEIPDGFVETSIILNSITVNAFSPTDDLNSDFLLIYILNDKGELELYQYDSINQTMQRYNENQIGDSSNKYVMTDEVITSDKYKNQLTTMAVIIAILGAVSITLTILLLHIYTKSRD